MSHPFAEDIEAALEDLKKGKNVTNRMTLTSIHKGPRKVPDRVLLVGTEGVGKSSWAADAPDPVFIAAEDGLHHLNVASFPEPRSFADVLAACDTLTAEEHGYQTVVLDTLDWIEPLIWAECCAEKGWESIETPGYGKGFTYAMDKWRKLRDRLDVLRARKKMEVILLAHAAIKPFSNPAGPDYNRYECKLQKSAAALVREWCDTNLFAIHEEFVADAKGVTKAKAVSTGRRVLKTVRTAAWDAKNRYGLPEELPLSYSDYVAAREAGRPAPASAFRAEAETLLPMLGEDVRTKATKAIKDAGEDVTVLARIVDRLRTLASELPTKEETK